MGFYGNITNIARTQFQFDRTYPSRYEMDAYCLTDEVYAGRYVLVEYDEAGFDGLKRAEIIDGKFYFENKQQQAVLMTTANTALKTVVYTAVSNNKREDPRDYSNCVFYMCTNGYKEGNPGSDEIAAEFREIARGTHTGDPESTPAYTVNYNIDAEHYGRGRGYDSTVWQKIYSEGNERYIMIAELNTVVPRFDVSADAPTMSPIVPHFDVNSTDVYYLLHMQPAWGMRVAAGEEGVSDETTTWLRESYNEKTGISTLQYYNGEEWVDKGNNDATELAAAIFYNKAGFEKDVSTHVDINNEVQILPTGRSGNKYNAHNGVTSETVEKEDIQEISVVLPVIGNTIASVWDILYDVNTESGNVRYRDVEWKDVVTGTPNQEIGGMTRNLETVAGCINSVHDLMGMIKTTKSDEYLNEAGFNCHYIYEERNAESGEMKYYRIHKYPICTPINEDIISGLPKQDESSSDQEYNEAYERYIATQLPLSEYFLIDSNGRIISTFNKKAISALTGSNIVGYKEDNFGYEYIEIDGMAENFGTIYGCILQIKNLLEVEDSETRDTATATGAINALNDIINVFEDLVPGEFLICDANGRVNSVNWTTKQKIGYTNIGKSSSNIPEDSGTENRWLKLSLNENVDGDDPLLFSLTHEFNEVDSTTTESDKNEEQKFEGSQNLGINNGVGDTLQLYTPIVDTKGHVVGNNIETVILPFGYKTIVSNALTDENAEDLYTKVTQREGNNEEFETKEDQSEKEHKTIASNTQDDLTITTINKWIQTKIKDDEISIAHEIHAIPEIKREHDLNNLSDDDKKSYHQDKITVQDTVYDAAGHVIENRQHTYTLPFGYKTITTNGRVAEDETKNNDGNIPESVENRKTVASDTQDTVALNSGNYWTRVDIENDVITLSHNVRDIDETSSPSSNFNEETGANNENNINIPDWTYDAAGHIRSKKDHYYTLPFGFKTIKTNGRGNDVEENATETPTTTDIVADTTQDELIINSGNKWIRIDTDVSADSITIRHDIHTPTLTKKEDTDLDEIGAFEVQDIQFDEAGHMTHNQVHKYVLPHNFRNINVSSSNEVGAGQNQSGTVEANDYKGEFNLTTQNRWITLKADASDDTISIGHAAAGGTTITTAGDTNSETPTFGSQFTIPYVQYDEMGHITEKGTRNITIPEGKLEYTEDKEDNSVSNVLTSINFTPKSGSIAVTHKNIGDLLLTGYEAGNESNNWIQATNSVNTAFRKIDDRLDGEISRAKEEESRIEGLIKTEINERTAITNKLGTASEKDVDFFAPENILSTQFNYNTDDSITSPKTIEDLFKMVANLQSRIEELESQIKTLMPKEETE